MPRELPDFDKMAAFAENNPEAFERFRRSFTRDFIHSVPPHLQRRLMGLQFEIDSKRRLAKTPLAACIRISEMMQDSFFNLQYELTKPAGTGHQSRQANATIIEFPDR
jgi:hypothetical protein